MKTKIISTLKNELLIVEIPKESTFREIFGLIGADENNSPNYHLTVYKFSDYTLLGTPDEIKEEDVKDLVEKVFGIGYKFGNTTHGKALDSFHSALESEIFWGVNPFKKPENYNLWAKYGDFTQYGVGLTTESLKWKEAQEKTFDKKRTLIFVKN